MKIIGELTVSTAAEHKAALTAALDTGAELDLDLSGVSELDTAGVQLLLVAQREAAHLGGRMRIVAPSQVVCDVLAIAHLTEHLVGGGAAEAEEAVR